MLRHRTIQRGISNLRISKTGNLLPNSVAVLRSSKEFQISPKPFSVFQLAGPQTTFNRLYSTQGENPNNHIPHQRTIKDLREEETLHKPHSSRKKLLYIGLGLILIASGVGIYLLIYADSQKDSVQKVLKFAATKHLENLKASGNSIEQRKIDIESLMEAEQKDAQDFENFLNEIDERNRNANIFWKCWEGIQVFRRFIYLLFKLVPLYVSSYFLSKDDWNQKVFNTLRTLGPCWIKLGQWIATRIDLFDPDLCQVLSQFHGEGYIHSMKDTRKIIEHSFGCKLEDMFSEFHEVPIGSGSIAQVYKAKLKGQDDYVAVKVRHPNVGTLLARDLRVLRVICKIVSTFPRYKWMNLDHNVVNFARNMNAQVDLRFEAENLKRFIENFKDIENVIFPTPYKATSDVLIEEYMNMKCIKEFINSPNENLKRTLAELGVFIFLKMLVKDNFLHGDLHSGNLFVTFLPLENNKNQFQPCFVVLDAGLVNQLTPANRAAFLQLFAAFVVDDAKTVATCLLDDHFMNTYIHYPEKLNEETKKNMEKFTESVQELLDTLNHGDVTNDRKVGPAAQKILAKAQEYRIPLQSNFTNLIISSIIVEGVGRLLYPNLPFLSQCEDLLRHASVEQARSYLKEKIIGYRVFGADTQ